MRRLFSLLILCSLVSPVMAQEPPKTDAAPTPKTDAQPPKADRQAPKVHAPASHSARQTWKEHFTQANVGHNGHLTLEEAKSGYPMAAKHFSDIDVDHKGYVTENDIRAWRIMRKAAHRLGKPPEDRLKPQHAYQWHYVDPHQAPLARTAALESPLPAAANPNSQQP